MAVQTSTGRPRGRAPGSPKTPGSGRRKGTPNRKTVATREQIGKSCDPIGLMCTVAAGNQFLAADDEDPKKRAWYFPSPDQRLDACRYLGNKLVPNLRSLEVAGEGGGPVELSLVDFLRGLPA